MQKGVALSFVVVMMLALFHIASPPPQVLEADDLPRWDDDDSDGFSALARDVVGILNASGPLLVQQATENSSIEGDALAADPQLASPPARRPRGKFCNGGILAHWRPGKCNDDRLWLLPWVAKRPMSKWTMVDVGANKGYVVASWLDVLLGAQRTAFTPRDLGIGMFSQPSIPKDLFKSACGGCCECVELPSEMPASSRAAEVKVWAFEPSPANYRWLRSFFTDTALVNVTHAAVSDRDGEAYFPDNPLGVEIGKVRETPAAGYVRVSVLKLDTYLKDVDFIDVLSTDAEGFDQDVARGASSFIRNGRVGVYQFEMYRDTDDYKRIFEDLGRWGYVCYFATESRPQKLGVGIVKGQRRTKRGPHPPVPVLVRITNCWEAEYKKYTGWVNALCYNTRVPHLHEIFTNLQSSIHRGGTGLCPGRLQQQRHILDFLRKFVEPHKAGIKWRQRD